MKFMREAIRGLDQFKAFWNIKVVSYLRQALHLFMILPWCQLETCARGIVLYMLPNSSKFQTSRPSVLWVCLMGRDHCCEQPQYRLASPSTCPRLVKSLSLRANKHLRFKMLVQVACHSSSQISRAEAQRPWDHGQVRDARAFRHSCSGYPYSNRIREVCPEAMMLRM